MAAAVSADAMDTTGPHAGVHKLAGKEQEVQLALTPPASDESRNGDGSRKDHISDEDSDLSEIENEDELAEYGKDIEMADASTSAPAAKINTPETEGAEETSETAEDDIYANVEPDRIEGGVPVFCPTMEQFKDFEKYMKAVNPYGMRSGIALVDPPEEWKRARNSLDEQVKTIRVKNPISQGFNGTGGFWTQENMEKQRSYNLPQWKGLCEQSEHQPPAARGTARGGTTARVTPRSNASKPRLDDLSEGQKRKAGRPRVNVLKDEAAETDEKTDMNSAVVAPPTPTSPDEQSVEKEEDVDDNTEEPPPTKPRGRPGRKPGSKVKGKPGRKPGAKSGPKQGPKSTGAGGASKKTSVASRRMHNQHIVNEDIDEEAFKDFDYHLAGLDEFSDERCSHLEQQYWKGLTFSPPMYGADMPGSLFDDDTKEWNVAKLPNVLDLLDAAVPGVNTAYLYLGMWKATFAWHLEDVDLYSINYIHFGAPKQWYSISQADAPKFEKAMKSLWPNDAKFCSQFLRHKTYLISPFKLLNDFGIKVNKIVHREGQFMITFPYGYHSGFNYGYNCAESVNFALEEWLTYAQTSQKCNCAEDSVFIDVHDILRKLHPEDYVDEYQEVTDDEDDEGQADLPTPPSSVKGKPGRKRKRQDDKAGKPGKKTKRIKINRGYQPCVLCPNNQDFDDLILTEDGKLAHRKCATYTVETFIVEENGRDVVKGINNIHKDKWALQCNYCRQKKGVCFQCHTPKCTRAYHATCAVMAGVQVDEADTPRFYEGVEYRDPIIDLRCKTHRTVKLSRPSTDSAATTQLAKTFSASYFGYAANLKVNDVIQYQVSHSDGITAAVVLRPYDGSGYLLVRSLGHSQAEAKDENNCIDISWMMFVDANTSTIPRCSANAKDMPKWVADKLLSEPEKLEAAERLPASGDPFIEGTEQTDKDAFFLKWDGFQNHSDPKNPDQKKVDILKENVLWHYMAVESSNSKDKYCADPARKVHDERSDFLASVPQPLKPVMAPPPKRMSLPASHPAVPPVQGQPSQAQQNVARRLEELQRNRQYLLQAQLQGRGQPIQNNRQEGELKPGLAAPNLVATDRQALDRQQSFIRQAGHGQGQTSYQYGGSSPHTPSPLRSESPLNSTVGVNGHAYNTVGGQYQRQEYHQSPAAGRTGQGLPSYQYAGAGSRPAQTTANPQPARASIPPSQTSGVAKPAGPYDYQRILQLQPQQARHEYTDAWKDGREYQRIAQQPAVVDQRKAQGTSSSSDIPPKFPLQNAHIPPAAVDHVHSLTLSGDLSTRPYDQSLNKGDQRRIEHNGNTGPTLAPALSSLSVSAIEQAIGRSTAQQLATSSTVNNNDGASDSVANGGMNYYANTSRSRTARGILPYQSPYADKRFSSANGLPVSTSGSITTPRFIEELGYTRRAVDSIPVEGRQSLNLLLGSTNGSANANQSQNRNANSLNPQGSPPPPSQGQVNKPSSNQSPSTLSLQDIEKRVHAPGGLRLVAGTIQLSYGNLADDLVAAAGARSRVNGSRRMGSKEWLDGVNEEEEALLRAKLKRMGVF